MIVRGFGRAFFHHMATGAIYHCSGPIRATFLCAQGRNVVLVFVRGVHILHMVAIWGFSQGRCRISVLLFYYLPRAFARGAYGVIYSTSSRRTCNFPYFYRVCPPLDSFRLGLTRFLFLVGLFWCGFVFVSVVFLTGFDQVGL